MNGDTTPIWLLLALAVVAWSVWAVLAIRRERRARKSRQAKRDRIDVMMTSDPASVLTRHPVVTSPSLRGDQWFIGSDDRVYVSPRLFARMVKEAGQ